MEFQQYLNPVGTQLSTDAKLIANAGGLLDVMKKKLDVENEQRQQVILDKMANEQYEAGRPSLSPSPGTPGGDGGIEDMIGIAKKTVESATAKAQALSAFPKASKIYQDEATNAMGRYTALVKERQDQKEKEVTYLQNVAGTMTKDEAGFNDGLAQIKATYPVLMSKIPFQKDQDGTIPFNPTNQRIAQNLFRSSVDQKAAWAREKQVTDIIDKQADNERQAARDAQQKLDEDRRAAQRQEESELRRQEVRERRAERASRDADKAEQTSLTRQDKLVKQAEDKLVKDSPVYKVFDNYKRALGTAEIITDKLGAKGGYQNITPADGQALVNSYRNLATEYRTRTGGKYDAAEVAKVDGLLQKMEKWVLTIGTGDPQVSRQGAVDVVKTINEQFNNANRIVVMNELQQLDKLGAQKVPIERLTLKGDYGRFVANKANGAMVKELDGKKYLLVKGKGYELPEGVE